MRIFILLMATSLQMTGAETGRGATPVKLAWPRPVLPPIQFAAVVAADGRMAKPFGIAVDGADRLFVTDPGQRAIFVYDRQAGTTTRWNGSARFPLDGPVGAAAAPDGRLFVADAYRPQVVVFSPSGEAVAAFGNEVLKRPQGIAVDPARGYVYVGDVRLHQVLLFDTKTLKLRHTAGGAAVSELFSMPAHLAVNSKGNLYVADIWNCRIQVFDPEGALVQRFPTECRGSGEYDRPHAIAIDRQDRIYVADANGNSLQIFQPDGQPFEFVAGLKAPAGQAAYVRTGIAVDRDNRIYLAEQGQGEGRVVVFTRGRKRMPSPPR